MYFIKLLCLSFLWYRVSSTIIPVVFYEQKYYNGYSYLFYVNAVEETDTFTCSQCYDAHDSGNQIKLTFKPLSVKVPDGYYIRFYENEPPVSSCHGDLLSFCDGNHCDCNSSHIDLKNGNQACYIENVPPQGNFCPGESDCSGFFACLTQRNCYSSQVNSFSVHAIPKSKTDKLSNTYPVGELGVFISLDICLFWNTGTVQLTKPISWLELNNRIDNEIKKTRHKRNLDPYHAEYRFFRTVLDIFCDNEIVGTFVSRVRGSERNNYIINFEFLYDDTDSFLGISRDPHRSYYYNIIYAIMVRLMRMSEISFITVDDRNNYRNILEQLHNLVSQIINRRTSNQRWNISCEDCRHDDVLDLYKLLRYSLKMTYDSVSLRAISNDHANQISNLLEETRNNTASPQLVRALLLGIENPIVQTKG